MLKAWPGTNIAKRIPVNNVQDIEKILVEYRRLFPEHLPHGVVSVTAAKLDDKFFMATDGKGSFHINEMEINGFNSKKDLLSGFAAIKSGQLLTQHQEYALETLWHEILHNRQMGLNRISKDDDDPINLIMETINQYVSRLSYAGFIEKLGGRAIHQDWVMANGYGYADYVNRLSVIFTTLGIEDQINGDLFNINFNEDVSKSYLLLANSIVKKTKYSLKEILPLLWSMITDEQAFFRMIKQLDRN